MKATLATLDDALNPAANWVRELHEMEDSNQEGTDINITLTDIQNFQARVRNPFVGTLKANRDVVSAFSIFNPKKTPNTDASEYQKYGADSVEVLLNHYGETKSAVSLQGEHFKKKGLVTDEVKVEWKMLKHYLTKKPEDDMGKQLQELTTNETLVNMFPNL